MIEIMIELINITKSFGDQTVLKQLNIQIEPHKTTAIIGASGSGKSTIFRILTGLETIDHGKILIDGAEVPHFKPPGFGYVIQDGGLFPHLTGQENIELAAKIQGLPLQDREKKTHELANLMSLPFDLLKKFPYQLSGGQKQRVALARSLFLDPHILLLDEPLGALDPIIRYDLQQELKEIFATLKKTVLLITHDLKEASYLSDVIHLIHQGKLLQTGTLKDFCETPYSPYVENFTKAYILGGQS